jgi:hypothetical protein
MQLSKELTSDMDIFEWFSKETIDNLKKNDLKKAVENMQRCIRTLNRMLEDVPQEK